MAAEVVRTAQAIVRNSANPGAILTIPGGLKPDARERLRKELSDNFSKNGAGRTAILDFETKFERAPTAEAMLSEAFVQLAKFGIAEVARAYNLPLSLLAETSTTNRSTAAEEARNFVIFSLAPLSRHIAETLDKLLLSDDERAAGWAISFDLTDALLGQGKERADYCSAVVNSGLATVNEARNWLGLGDVDGGDILCRPVNTQPQDLWLAGPPKPEAPAKPAAEAPAAPPAPNKTYEQPPAIAHPPARKALSKHQVRLKLLTSTASSIPDFVKKVS